MKHLLQIYSDDAIGEFERLAEDERNAVLGEYLAIRQSPAVIGGERLQPVETATNQARRNRDSEPAKLVDDWPKLGLLSLLLGQSGVPQLEPGGTE